MVPQPPPTVPRGTLRRPSSSSWRPRKIAASGSTPGSIRPTPKFWRFQPDVDVLLLREGEHLLETLFAAKPRLLEAAEWRAEKVLADLIDPYVTRLHSERGAVRGIQIIGPDRSRESIFDSIHGCEHLRFIAPFKYTENRPEDLLTRYSVLLGDGEDCRLNEEPVLEGRIDGRPATGDEFGAFIFG